MKDKEKNAINFQTFIAQEQQKSYPVQRKKSFVAQRKYYVREDGRLLFVLKKVFIHPNSPEALLAFFYHTAHQQRQGIINNSLFVPNN